jgi:hypothetical protein
MPSNSNKAFCEDGSITEVPKWHVKRRRTQMEKEEGVGKAISRKSLKVQSWEEQDSSPKLGCRKQSITDEDQSTSVQ